jgi:hypothetical protein
MLLDGANTYPQAETDRRVLYAGFASLEVINCALKGCPGVRTFAEDDVGRYLPQNGAGGLSPGFQP